jgi:hypothetical protein
LVGFLHSESKLDENFITELHAALAVGKVA